MAASLALQPLNKEIWFPLSGQATVHMQAISTTAILVPCNIVQSLAYTISGDRVGVWGMDGCEKEGLGGQRQEVVEG